MMKGLMFYEEEWMLISVERYSVQNEKLRKMNEEYRIKIIINYT
jgi:hypothetical protein